MEGYPSLVKGTVLKTVRSPCGAWVRIPHLPYPTNKGDTNGYSEQTYQRKMDQRTA